MEKFIEVHDDVISPNLATNFEQLILNGEISYKYLQNVTTSTNSYSPGFGYLLIKNEPFPRELISPYCFNFFQIPYQLCSKLNLNLFDIIKARIFLQIPNINTHSNGIHVDMINSDTNKVIPHWVCLYYVTDSDGDTILYKEDKQTEIKRITPKKGRIVFFDGSIPHCSTPPSKNHRIVINFNFIGEKL